MSNGTKGRSIKYTLIVPFFHLAKQKMSSALGGASWFWIIEYSKGLHHDANVAFVSKILNKMSFLKCTHKNICRQTFLIPSNADKNHNYSCNGNKDDE